MSMNNWQEYCQRYRAEWTGRGQGIATDGVSWFVTQNDHRPGVSRYSADFSTLEARAEIPRTVAGHVGAVSHLDGTISIALENPERLITFSKDLEQLSIVPIIRPVEQDNKAHLAWCSINPKNGLLYTSDWNFADRLVAYDPTTGAAQPSHDIELDTMVHRVQGGSFTNDGRIYLAADDQLGIWEMIRVMLRLTTPSREVFPGIHCFGLDDGARYDFRRIPTRPLLPFFEEIEGIAIGDMVVDGLTRHVHLSFLKKNHTWVRDDVFIMSFAVPRVEQAQL